MLYSIFAMRSSKAQQDIQLITSVLTAK